MPPQPDEIPVTSETPEIPTPTPLRNRLLWYLFLIVFGVVCYLAFNYFGNGNARDGMPEEVYNGVAKAIHDRDGIDTKSLTFKLDQGVNDYRGEQYTGTLKLPNGQPAKVMVWLQHVSNAKGGEWLYHWSMAKPGQPTTKEGP